ncbi:MAG TPA: class I SAM-dependent methyltransferase [Burkholderiales bacterium]|nr:class I SAM-dependent methyltransferase [Burkholderiales bacterium]
MLKTVADTHKAVEQFWNNRPCDSDRSGSAKGTKAYFDEIERDRYAHQGHILTDAVGRLDWNGKRVLEIGTGVGTDARKIVERGARYTGINIDQASVDMTALALRLYGLPGTVEKHDATALPYADASFDVVYSFGAFPCIPDLESALAEIHRVLRPGGDLVALFYNRASINYQVEIRVLRRLARPLLVVPGVVTVLNWLGLPKDRLVGHRELYRAAPKMSAEEWLSRNTDGPDNPYICIHDAADVERLLRRFEIVRHTVHYFDYRHWGVIGALMPKRLIDWLGSRWGWHRVVHARKARR